MVAPTPGPCLRDLPAGIHADEMVNASTSPPFWILLIWKLNDVAMSLTADVAGHHQPRAALASSRVLDTQVMVTGAGSLACGPPRNCGSPPTALHDQPDNDHIIPGSTPVIPYRQARTISTGAKHLETGRGWTARVYVTAADLCR